MLELPQPEKEVELESRMIGGNCLYLFLSLGQFVWIIVKEEIQSLKKNHIKMPTLTDLYQNTGLLQFVLRKENKFRRYIFAFQGYSGQTIHTRFLSLFVSIVFDQLLQKETSGFYFDRNLKNYKVPTSYVLFKNSCLYH